MNQTQYTKNCVKTVPRINGSRARVCGKEFVTLSYRADWCDGCIEALITTSLKLSAAAEKYRTEQRDAGLTKLAGRWIYDTTDMEAK